MSSHKETAQKVVEVFSIIDKGTLTDARHKDTILQISAAIVSDALLREERAANMAEFKAQRDAELPVKAEEAGGTSAELNTEGAVHEPEAPAPEVEEKPVKAKSKKAKPEAAPEAVAEAADEEAPF